MREGLRRYRKKRLGSGPLREKDKEWKMSEKGGGLVQLEDMARQSKARQEEKRVRVSVGE